MTHRLAALAIVLALGTSGAAQAPVTQRGPENLVVHEWGTFTSVAGPDGEAVEWLPLAGPPDLPCFVEHVDFNVKGSLPGKVRMETPVLYFYSPTETTVNVTARFRHGVVTEWFPHASVTPATVEASTLKRADAEGRITWTGVKVSPGAGAALPNDATHSHYYAARQTDALQLQVGPAREKFLFYRGVGGFEPPVSATVARDGRIAMRSASGGAIGDVVLFENRGGTMAYQVRHVGGSRAEFDQPVLDGESVAPLAELEQLLIAHGLYPKEAKAMIETWRDSWFEEGSRLFYIAPRLAVDGILPLTVTPAPSSVARVFVGRIELITATTEREVAHALETNDRAMLARYGRFLQPIADRLVADRPAKERTRLLSSLNPFYQRLITTPPACH
jgi:hypothetical protein